MFSVCQRPIPTASATSNFVSGEDFKSLDLFAKPDEHDRDEGSLTRSSPLSTNTPYTFCAQHQRKRHLSRQACVVLPMLA